MRWLLVLAACTQSAHPDAPPGIVALRPAPDFAVTPDAEIVVIVDSVGARGTDAAQALAAQIAQRVPDLVVTAVGRGVYDYGAVHIDVGPREVSVVHAGTGDRVIIDAHRLRALDAATVVRVRKRSLDADAFDLDGNRISPQPLPVRHARVQ